jgi:hypothetical protein
MLIAFDAYTAGGDNGGSSNSLTYSHTCTGSNGILFVGVRGDVLNDYVTSATYNGVAMSLAGKQICNGDRYVYLFYLKGPATGTHNVVVTASQTILISADSTSYTGASQGVGLDATSVQQDGGSSPSNFSITTVADNCWVIECMHSQSNVTAGVGTTLRSDGTIQRPHLCDTNGPKTPAGSVTLSLNITPDYKNTTAILASFEPFGMVTEDETFTEDASILQITNKTIDNDGNIKILNSDNIFTEDCLVLNTLNRLFTEEGIVQNTSNTGLTEDGLTRDTFGKIFSDDGIVRDTFIESIIEDGIIHVTFTKDITENGLIRDTFNKTFSDDSIIRDTFDVNITNNGIVKYSNNRTFTSDAIIVKANQILNFTNNGNVLIANIDKNFTDDAIIHNAYTFKSLSNDGYVSVVSPGISGPMWALFTHKCNVKRRATYPIKDALNAPSYGTVNTWMNVYVNLPCRLEISSSDIQFKPTGERVAPTNILYVDVSTPLKIEDRVFMVFDSKNDVAGLGYQQEFIVQGTVPALTMLGQTGHHSEYILVMP